MGRSHRKSLQMGQSTPAVAAQVARWLINPAGEQVREQSRKHSESSAIRVRYSSLEFPNGMSEKSRITLENSVVFFKETGVASGIFGWYLSRIFTLKGYIRVESFLMS